MSDYAAKIQAIETAMASGVRTVESDGERITYQSVDEMRTAIAYLRDQGAAQIGRRRIGTTLAVFDRG